MKKFFLLMCFLGTALPYYYLYQFILANNGIWSTSQFFTDSMANYASSMLSADLGVAAFTFFVFIIYKFYKNPLKIIKYLIPFFLVGFSLALPLYFYDNYSNDKN